MPNYELSKLYLITTKIGQNDGYIGATTKNYLTQKFQTDIACYQSYKSGKTNCPSPLYNFFDEHGVSNCRIVLIETYPCKSKDELSSKLFDIINKTSNCVNNNPAYLPVSLGLPLDRGIQITEEERQEYINNNTHTVCECGGRYTTASKKPHLKSKKHVQYELDLLKGVTNDETPIETSLIDQTESQEAPY